MTAGIDESVRVRKFINLPAPVVWWEDRTTRPNWTRIDYGPAEVRSVSTESRIRWVFPVDTVVGEVLSMQVGTDWLPFEIRTRTKEPDDWGVDVLRPFVDPADLREAVGGDLRPYIVRQLTLVAHDSHHPRSVIRRQIDQWELTGPDQLTRELLLRPFESSLGEPWMVSGLVAPDTYEAIAGLDRFRVPAVPSDSWHPLQLV